MPEIFSIKAERKDPVRDLFALVFDHVRRDGSPFVVQQATLLQWARSATPKPTLDDLKAGLRGGPPPDGWPWPITESAVWKQLQADSSFLGALKLAIEAAPFLGVNTADEICIALAYVAQTVGNASQTLKEDNLAEYNARVQNATESFRRARLQTQLQQRVADSYRQNQQLTSPSQPLAVQPLSPGILQTRPAHPSLTPVPRRPPVVERPEPWPIHPEQSSREFLSTERMAVWHASHTGPAYAQKGENQDSTFAVADGSRVFFALADGVSTSYGSRFSAIAIANMFCSNLQRILQSVSRPDAANLREAATDTHTWLDSALSFLLANSDAPEWKDVRGASNVGDETALHLFENTRNPSNRFWGPVMAATLVGGVVQPAADGGSLDLYAIRVGDGLIEHVESLRDAGEVFRILSMDSGETEIAASLSPGPPGRKSLVNPEIIQCSIGAGEVLLISSDGLTRGHRTTVFQQLREIVGTPSLGLCPGDSQAAFTVLQRAADYADAAFTADQKVHLFDDNLSLIVVGGAG